MQSMSELLIQVLWVLGGVLLFLSLYIILNKATREYRESRRSRIRKEIEPLILDYVNGKGNHLADLVSPGRGRIHRGVVEEVLLDHARFLRGNARERITAACEEFGFVEERIRQLRNPR